MTVRAADNVCGERTVGTARAGVHLRMSLYGINVSHWEFEQCKGVQSGTPFEVG
jgi:hypothetical protein